MTQREKPRPLGAVFSLAIHELHLFFESELHRDITCRDAIAASHEETGCI